MSRHSSRCDSKNRNLPFTVDLGIPVGCLSVTTGCLGLSDSAWSPLAGIRNILQSSMNHLCRFASVEVLKKSWNSLSFFGCLNVLGRGTWHIDSMQAVCPILASASISFGHGMPRHWKLTKKPCPHKNFPFSDSNGSDFSSFSTMLTLRFRLLQYHRFNPWEWWISWMQSVKTYGAMLLSLLLSALPLHLKQNRNRRESFFSQVDPCVGHMN